MYDKVSKGLYSVGVKVIFLKHTEGISSTILEQIIKNNL